MKILADTILDDYYSGKVTKNRFTSKGVILDEFDNILLIHIKGNDIFGARDHLELPGGGIENQESPIYALKREIKEELGYSIKNIKPIGIIGIEYKLLNRIDIGHFYSAKIDQFYESELLDYEKMIFSDIIRVNINDVVSYYENHKAILVGEMIQRRDLIVIKEYLRKRKIEMEIKNLLSYKNFVVMGSTTNEEKAAYEIKNLLIEKGYNVRCVGKELQSLNLVDFDIDVLVMAMNPGRSINFLKESNKTYKAVVIQPGAESDELLAYLDQNNITYYHGCILMALKSL